MSPDEAWSIVVEYLPKIGRIVRKRFGGRHVFDDCVQNAAVLFARELTSGKVPPGKVENFATKFALIAIQRTLESESVVGVSAYGRWGAKGRGASKAAEKGEAALRCFEPLTFNIVGPEDAEPDPQTESDVRDALQSLTDRQYQVVSLRLDEWTTWRIAAELGCTREAIRCTENGAYKKLRKHLAKYA